MRGAGELQPAADHGTLERGDDRHAAILHPIEHPVPHLGMPQAFGRIVIGQFGQVETRGEVVADTVYHNRADIVGEVREAITERKNDAVVERVALGGAVEADGLHRAASLDREQGGLSCGRGASHGIIMSCPE